MMIPWRKSTVINMSSPGPAGGQMKTIGRCSSRSRGCMDCGQFYGHCCRWDKQDEAEARVGVGQSEDYLDSETEGDSSYAETVNTVQSVEVADRQFTTVG